MLIVLPWGDLAVTESLSLVVGGAIHCTHILGPAPSCSRWLVRVLVVCSNPLADDLAP